MKRSCLIAIAAVLLYGCSSATMVPTVPAVPTSTVRPERTPTAPQSSPTATAVPTAAAQLPTECPAAGPGNSWDRYTPGTFADLISNAEQVISSENTSGISLYIETSNEFQFPSCVVMVYSGKFREIPEDRKFLIEAWSGIYGPEMKAQLTEILKHEVLLTENGQEHWVVVQEPLISYMEKELTENGEVVVFTIWAGSRLGEEKDHVFIVNEFSKP
jgi:hypothetical protein